jgi:uncharacterized protein with von Willebrand factor type A (vWA) domain
MINMEKYEVIEPERQTHEFVIDKKVVNRLTSIFSSIQGDKYNKKSNKGKINIKNYINYRLDKSQTKFFDKVKQLQGGTIIILVDGSGTMRFDNRMAKCRNLVSSLYASLEKSTNIDFKVYVYGGSFTNRHIMAIKEIKNLDECKYLTHDAYYNGSTPTHYATDYVLEQNKDIIGKKMLITITDGIPEVWQNNKRFNDPEINEKTKQSYVKAENMGFNIFGISIDIREQHKENFKKIFRQKYVNIVELEQMKTRMVRKIEEFTKTLE